MQARKKSVVICFYPIENMEKAYDELPNWIRNFGDNPSEHLEIQEPVTRKEDIEIKVKTLEGTSYEISTKDVIIRGVKGEYYPCKKDIFEDTYDVLSE